jgi:hypothetical protein
VRNIDHAHDAHDQAQPEPGDGINETQQNTVDEDCEQTEHGRRAYEG